LGGKPLYKWTVDFLVANKKYFEDIVFSSDSPLFFDLPKGVKTLKRPKPLCEDKMPHVMSVRHALLHMEKSEGKEYDYVMLFQPTNPLRHRNDLKQFIETMTAAKMPLGKTYYVDENINPSYIEQATMWEEETEPNGVIIRSGNMYSYSRQFLLANTIEQVNLSSFYIMVPKHRGYNINNRDDFDIVDAFIRRYECTSKT
jgi:CMP-N-acetylneuraminic acid synthetase